MASPTPNLTLHHLHISQSERIAFLLSELSIPYNLKTYTRSPLLSPPDLKSLHPLGASPLLIDSTTSPAIELAESSAIAEYILTRYGNGRLVLGPDDKNYADYLYWFHFANGTLQPGMFRRAMMRNICEDGVEDPRFKGMDAKLKGIIRHFDERVRKNKWLAGEEFTAADVMCMWCFSTMRMFEPVDLSEFEGIVGWMGRVSERKGYREAMERIEPGVKVEELISVEGPKEFKDGLFGKSMRMVKKKEGEKL